MLQIFHTVGSLTGHFLHYVCVRECVCVRASPVKEDYKLPKLSPSIQSLMMEGLKSSARKSHTDTLNGLMHLQVHTQISEYETCRSLFNLSFDKIN